MTFICSGGQRNVWSRREKCFDCLTIAHSVHCYASFLSQSEDKRDALSADAESGLPSRPERPSSDTKQLRVMTQHGTRSSHSLTSTAHCPSQKRKFHILNLQQRRLWLCVGRSEALLGVLCPVPGSSRQERCAAPGAVQGEGCKDD